MIVILKITINKSIKVKSNQMECYSLVENCIWGKTFVIRVENEQT